MPALVSPHLSALLNFPGPKETPEVETNSGADPVSRDDELYSRWKWWVLLATMACYLFFCCGRFNLPRFFMDVAGWKIKGAGFVAAALPLGMAFGALSGGFLSDKLFRGKRAGVICLSLVLCAICTVIIPRVAVEPSALTAHAQTSADNVPAAAAATADVDLAKSTKAAVVAMLLLSGFMLYVCIGPYFALCPDLLGVENAGTGIGIMDAIAYGFAAAGTATIGRLIDARGYGACFWFMAGCAVLGALLIVFIREED